MKKVIAILATGSMLILFQNCQKSTFSEETSATNFKSDSQLVPVIQNDPEDAEGEILQPDEDTGNNNEGPRPKGPPGQTPPGLNNNPGHSNTEGGYYVCILDGPGKSVKMGIATQLQGQNPIPGVVCVTRHGCLEIASQYFTVKGPEFRGYCKLPHGNPHVSHMTDAELQKKIDELKAAP